MDICARIDFTAYKRRDKIMLSKIEYVYGKDKANEVQLLGAKVFSFDGKDIQDREFYVGKSYSVDELCSNIELANSIGIKDLNLLSMRAKSINSTGIIYFPQTESYGFLGNKDIIVPYIENLSVEDTLEQAIAPFRENTLTREALMDYVNQLYHDLDPENSLSELCDLPLSRQKVSAR